MKPSIYGKKVFIADLILVSVWTFFFSRYCSPGLLLLIPIRIALSFEMNGKSKWTLVSAIAFFIAYSAVNNFDRPFERMFFNFFCMIGESELMVDIFSKPLEWEMKAWIGGFSALWYIWLVVLPVFIGIRQHRIKDILWQKNGIWIYILLVTAFCVWLMFDEGEVGAILWGLFIALLPLVYWTIYERKGRSLMQLIIENKQIQWYLAYTVFMLSTVTIGLKDIFSLKLIGLLVLPPLFYIMLMKSARLGVVLTRCCVALSIAGLLYWLSYDVEQCATIVLLCLAVALIVFVGVTMIVRTRKWTIPIVLMVSVPIVIAPCLLGMNPYIITDSEHTHMYVTNISVRNGVYVVEKYIETNVEGKPYRCKRVQGLRDRYGIILPMKYEELKPLDRWGRYIAVNAPERYGCMESDQRYGIYDLRYRKFVLNPATIEVTELGRIDDRTFKLINPEGRYFATLYLPGEYRERYYPDAHVEPHFADGETSAEEFLGRAQNPDLDIDNQYWKAMRKKNPQAYRLMVQMYELAGEESSPINDLNYARAIREIVKQDRYYYKGNLDKALSDVAKLSETITDSGSQQDINTWTDFLRLISSVRTSLAYDSIMSANQDNECIDKEYTAWHNLIEAMAYYLDYLYSTESYRTVPEEKNTRIIGWLDYRREALEREYKILSGKLVYAVEPAKADSLKSTDDYEKLFSRFHYYSDKNYYHPMWNEVKYAFDEWKHTRAKVAEGLEAHKRLSYEEFSREVIDSVFSCIEGLD